MKDLMKTLLPDLDPVAAERFDTYYQLLTEKNKVMNLTAVTGKEDVAKKHFVDSLAALPYLRPGARVIDVGTGAGFPGIPLLIMVPEMKLTLADSLNKRLLFLEDVLKALSLNAEIVHGRAEDLGQNKEYREKYDVALSRAVAPLNVLLELTTPFVHSAGLAIAYKGKTEEELPAAKNAAFLLHVSLRDEKLVSDIGERHLVIAEKTAPTPKFYPRKAGTPSRKPL